MMAVLCGYLAIYPVIAVRVALKLGDPRWLAFYLPVSWLLAEWLRSWMLSGFPWLSIGYSQLSSPLSGWLPVIGETGTSALLIMLSTGAAIALQMLSKNREEKEDVQDDVSTGWHRSNR